MSSSHFTNIIYQQPTDPIDRFCINELQIKNIKEGRKKEEEDHPKSFSKQNLICLILNTESTHAK